MLDTGKVIWKEGMFLQPQHFQQQERFLLGLMQERFRSCFPFSFGLSEIVVERDALANGLFAVTKFRGILPDGIALDMPKENPLPPPRSFADYFTHDMQSLDVHLGVPLAVDGRTNAVSGGNADITGVRYTSRPVEVADEVLGSQRKEIDIGTFNAGFVFGGESLDSFASIPVARLVRKPSGEIALDETFIPPVTTVGASSHLLNLIRGLLELLLAKVSSLSQARRQIAGGSAQFTSAEETAFRLLQTLNTYTPLLNHYHVSPMVHPFDLFSLLTQFTGSLCSFSSAVSIRELPRYDHYHLNQVFSQFEKVVREILQADISAGSVSLPLSQINPSTYAAQASDGQLFSTAKLYLGVKANAPEKELIVGVVQRMKICAKHRLDVLISSAMPGVQLIHTARPPENLSTKPGYQYFLLNQQGDLWKEIAETSAIGMYFPNNYQNLDLELIALRQ